MRRAGPGSGAAGGRRRAHVEVERVRAVEVEIVVGGGDVGVPERERVVALQPERALGVLAQPVERRPAGGERRGQLQVPVLEGEARGGVEEDVPRGAAGHGEAERGGVEGEGEVGGRRREDAAARRGVAPRARVELDVLPGRLAGDDVLGDLPPRVVGVGDADVEPAARLKPAAGVADQ